MSSKRGRKRNDNLPPNRARDVQRAFRARRAAHLLALEQRVTELEVENAKLRKIVGWAPDERPPLGRGPTGKDRPKLGDAAIGSHVIDFFSSRGSESADSSSRTGSLSPSAIVGAASNTMHVIDADTWENALTMGEHNDSPDIASPEASYQLPPLVPPSVPSKPVFTPYGNSIPPSLSSSASRSSLPSSNGSMYINSQTSYSHPSERHLASSYSSPGFVARDNLRAASPRQHYNYHSSSYQNHDLNIHSQTPPPFSSPPPNGHLHQRNISSPFPHRRSLTEHTYPMGHNLHLPNPAHMQAQQHSRQSDLHPMPDGNERHQQPQLHQRQHSNPYPLYNIDGSITSMP